MCSKPTAVAAAPPSWFRQLQVLITNNRRLLMRRPIHLAVQIFSSVLSVVFAWLAGRDARGPQGAFPPLTDCGLPDPEYIVSFGDDYEAKADIPMSLNEPWRGGLPVWLMGLGPTFAGISAFLILRDELQSRRWGMLKAADSSAQWLSWLFCFAVLGAVNALLGAITAAALPNAHALESVDFGVVFGTLLFLNVALDSASSVLAALCGTIQSAFLTAFIVLGMIVASSVPAIAASANNAWPSASSTMYGYTSGYQGGAFWLYASTEQANQNWDYNVDPDTFEYDYDNPVITVTKCEVPIVSYDQSRFYKTDEEREDVSKQDIFQVRRPVISTAR